MTNYNDGDWHVWDGVMCPVHTRSVVELIRRNKKTGELISYEGTAGETEFSGGVGWNNSIADMPIIAFRVVKEHREPREWWLNPETGNSQKVEWHHTPDKFTDFGYIKVREVLE